MSYGENKLSNKVSRGEAVYKDEINIPVGIPVNKPMSAKEEPSLFRMIDVLEQSPDAFKEVADNIARANEELMSLCHRITGNSPSINNGDIPIRDSNNEYGPNAIDRLSALSEKTSTSYHLLMSLVGDYNSIIKFLTIKTVG